MPFVDGVHRAVVRDADVFVREAEDAERRVVGEAIDAVAGGVNEHGGGAIDDVARRHLAVARLEKIFQCYRRADGRDAAVDGENCADGDVHINIGRTIERVGEDDVLGVAVLLALEGDEILFFFGGEPGDVVARHECRLHLLVRENVQLLLRLALHVFRTGFAENVIDQPGAVDVAVQHLGGETDGGENPAQFALACGYSA